MKSAKTLAFALAAAVVTTAAPLVAQQSLSARFATRTSTSGTAADQLHDRAIAMGERGTTDGWREAAHLHLQSAGMRSASDALAERCAHEAADLLYATGDLAGAQAAVLSSAEHAAARGDVISAANSYLDAAVVANDRRQSASVREYTEKARLLAASPLLSEGQRHLLLTRMPQ